MLLVSTGQPTQAHSEVTSTRLAWWCCAWHSQHGHHAFLLPYVLFPFPISVPSWPSLFLPAGLTTNVINGGLECGSGTIKAQEADRIGYYKRYCDIFGIPYGSNLDCATQHHY